MSTDSRHIRRKPIALFIAFAWGIATLIAITIAAIIFGFVASAGGFVHGEPAAWYPLFTAFYGFLAGLAIGAAVAWWKAAGAFGVSRAVSWKVAILLLVVIPAIEYAVLRSPRMTGPSSSTSRLNIEAISNGGDLVLITVSRENSSLTYKVDTQTGNATRLTDANDFEEAPDLSPDGKQIVFISRRDHDSPSELVICDVNGKNTRRLLPRFGNEFAPTFSATGNLIYFARPTSPERYARAYEIYSVKPDGTDLNQITHANFGAGDDIYSLYPESISSDGTQVLMNARTKTGDKLFIFSLTDQSRSPAVVSPRIPNGPADAQIAHAYFSADAKRILLMAASQGAKGYDYDVYDQDLQSGAVRKVTSTNGYASDFRLSSNGESAALFTWSLSRLNSVPIEPKLQVVDIPTQRGHAVIVTGLP